MQEYLNLLMQQPGAIGYVVINYDGILSLSICHAFSFIGIPVKAHPDDQTLSVQYAALIADLVMKTKQTLKQLN